MPEGLLSRRLNMIVSPLSVRPGVARRLPRTWLRQDVCRWILSDDVLIQDRSLSFGMICHPLVKPHVCFDYAHHPLYTIFAFDWFQSEPSSLLFAPDHSAPYPSRQLARVNKTA